MGDFGDFQEIEIKGPQTVLQTQAETQVNNQMPARARLPRKGQLIGVVLERLGGKRMSVKATDKKIRNCRVPGRFKRKFWLREGNFVLIEPWPDDDEKGDIVYQYRGGEEYQLRKTGALKGLESDF